MNLDKPTTIPAATCGAIPHTVPAPWPALVGPCVRPAGHVLPDYAEGIPGYAHWDGETTWHLGDQVPAPTDLPAFDELVDALPAAARATLDRAHNARRHAEAAEESDDCAKSHAVRAEALVRLGLLSTAVAILAAVTSILVAVFA